MNITIGRVAKAAIGILIVVVLLYVVTGWWGDYRQATRAAKTSAANSKETTATTPAKKKAPAESETPTKTVAAPTSRTVVITTDGLNFRREPDGETIRGLDQGDRLKLIKRQEGWLRVEDSEGTRGWISASSSYSRVE